MTRYAIAVLLTFVFFTGNASLLLAQQTSSTSDWSAVQQLKTNERLVVKQKNGKEISGAMIEATDVALTIERNHKPFTIARADVREVHRVSGKAAKGKWALIGAGIGAAVGAGIGATQVSSRDDSGIYLPMGMLLGTGAGAASGLLVGQTRRHRELVYGSY